MKVTDERSALMSCNLDSYIKSVIGPLMNQLASPVFGSMPDTKLIAVDCCFKEIPLRYPFANASSEPKTTRQATT